MTATSSRFLMLALLAGCARPQAAPPGASSGAPASAPPVAQPAAQGALASFAAQPLIVLPAQALRMTVPDWSDKVGDPRAYLATIDDEIAFAVRERGLRGKWAFPADLVRSARRNPTYAADPYTIALGPLAPVERDAEKIITEPLSGQLRAFAGLWDARYALIPVEVKLAPDDAGARATIHLVIVDTRAAKLIWKGDVSGDPTRAFSPAVAAGVAGRVADLFTPAR